MAGIELLDENGRPKEWSEHGIAIAGYVCPDEVAVRNRYRQVLAILGQMGTEYTRRRNIRDGRTEVGIHAFIYPPQDEVVMLSEYYEGDGMYKNDDRSIRTERKRGHLPGDLAVSEHVGIVYNLTTVPPTLHAYNLTASELPEVLNNAVRVGFMAEPRPEFSLK